MAVGHFNDVVTHLVTRYRERLGWDSHRLTYNKLQSYAEYIGARGIGASVWGFVDGALEVVCRPTRGQRRWYVALQEVSGGGIQGIKSIMQ